jgi:hypothetical protein
MMKTSLPQPPRNGKPNKPPQKPIKPNKASGLGFIHTTSNEQNEGLSMPV